MGKVIGGIAVALVVAIAVCFLLFGKGLLGLGGGDDSGNSTGSAEKGATPVATTLTFEDNVKDSEDITSSATEDNGIIEIRVQGREYNYQNITFGNEKHSLEELLNELSKLSRDTRIDLIVEDNATKNAVDELESQLINAGFTDIRK